MIRTIPIDPAEIDRAARYAQALIDAANAISEALAAASSPAEGIAASLGIAHEGDKRIAAIVAEVPRQPMPEGPTDGVYILRREIRNTPIRRAVKGVRDAD